MVNRHIITALKLKVTECFKQPATLLMSLHSRHKRRQENIHKSYQNYGGKESGVFSLLLPTPELRKH